MLATGLVLHAHITIFRVFYKQATFQKPTPDSLQVSLTGTLRTKVDDQGANLMVALYECGLVTDCADGPTKVGFWPMTMLFAALKSSAQSMTSHPRSLSPELSIFLCGRGSMLPNVACPCLLRALLI
ncbi:UNVERIFIED_CONTAM: hypothetical protein Scaly_1228000 [Sesamum calycinum]|uniref:Uncharacterized protein n=1 Tax=Sesamum calycinum TaxID=2727403 RepID=A0AAW2Q4J1_9LAMI